MKYIKTNIYFLIISLVIVSGCINNNSQQYVKGELWITFNDNINKTQAEEIINEYNLTIIYHSSNNLSLYKIKVPFDEENSYIEILKENPGIKDVKRVLEKP